MTKEMTVYEVTTALSASALELGKSKGHYEYAYALGMMEARHMVLLNRLKAQHPDFYDREIKDMVVATENNLKECQK